jgi:hypothetical protein
MAHAKLLHVNHLTAGEDFWAQSRIARAQVHDSRRGSKRGGVWEQQIKEVGV